MNSKEQQPREPRGCLSRSDDQKNFVCHHNFDKKNIEEYKAKLRKGCRSLEKKIALIDKKLEDVDDFFEAFGSLNRGNVATTIMDMYSERKLGKHEQLTENLLNLENQMDHCRKKLNSLDDEAILEKCPCMSDW